MYASIAVENISFGIDKEYIYSVPADFEKSVFVSQRVLIPFGNSNKPRIGFIVDLINDKPDIKKIRNISDIIDFEPILNSQAVNLAKWMSEKYFCTLFDCLKAMLPCGINYKVLPSYAVSDVNADYSLLSKTQQEIFFFLKNEGSFVQKEKILSSLGLTDNKNDFEFLVRKGYIICRFDTKRSVSDAEETMIRLNNDYNEVVLKTKITAKQQSVIDLLSDVENASVKEICALLAMTSAVCKALVKKGVCEIYNRPVYRIPFKDDCDKIGQILLSDEQQNVYKKISNLYNKNESKVALLHGVTGSGKTSVYLKLIEDAVNNGDNVIVMVPEISLTHQTISIFKKRFGNKIAVFHSALSMGEKLDEYKRVKNGEVKIAIGTRSAVFAPFEKVSLIVIDEEQEHTYKSESAPRYHAREIAKFRIHMSSGMLLLASATPSIESYAKAKSGIYSLFELNERYGKSVLPDVVCVNLSTQASAGEKSFISKQLFDELKKNIDNKEQSILLLNRRGYNTFVVCKSCSHVMTCPNCSISMTYHSVTNNLICHYCGYTTKMISRCPQCSSENILYRGVGTQRIESELNEMLPGVRILRIDADTTGAKHAFEEKFESFKKGEYDIMVGTQMVAKGLDFENVTLVGVISADQQLYYDDYRSTERAFSLLTQVIGRCGRGEKKGRAIIQTFTPENEAIVFAENQDYKSFYNHEILIRQTMIYPPYCDLCVIGFVGNDETKVKVSAYAFFSELKNNLEGEYKDLNVIILGPVPLKVVKVSNKYRYRLIIKCKNSSLFRRMISKMLIDFSKNSMFNSITAYADINPENLL